MPDQFTESAGMPKDELSHLIQSLGTPPENPFDVPEPGNEFLECFSAVYPELPLRSDPRIREALIQNTRQVVPVGSEFVTKVVSEVSEPPYAPRPERAPWEHRTQPHLKPDPKESQLYQHTDMEFDVLFDQELPNGQRGELFRITKTLPGKQLITITRGVHNGMTVDTRVDVTTETDHPMTKRKIYDEDRILLEQYEVNPGKVDVSGFTLSYGTDGVLRYNGKPLTQGHIRFSNLPSLITSSFMQSNEARLQGLLDGPGLDAWSEARHAEETLSVADAMEKIRRADTANTETATAFLDVLAGIPGLDRSLLHWHIRPNDYAFDPQTHEISTVLREDGGVQLEATIRTADPKQQNDTDTITIWRIGPKDTVKLQLFLRDGNVSGARIINSRQDSDNAAISIAANGLVEFASGDFKYLEGRSFGFQDTVSGALTLMQDTDGPQAISDSALMEVFGDAEIGFGDLEFSRQLDYLRQITPQTPHSQEYILQALRHIPGFASLRPDRIGSMKIIPGTLIALDAAGNNGSFTKATIEFSDPKASDDVDTVSFIRHVEAGADGTARTGQRLGLSLNYRAGTLHDIRIESATLARSKEQATKYTAVISPMGEVSGDEMIRSAAVGGRVDVQGFLSGTVAYIVGHDDHTTIIPIRDLIHMSPQTAEAVPV
jgi:hypothetical protein